MAASDDELRVAAAAGARAAAMLLQGYVEDSVRRYRIDSREVQRQSEATSDAVLRAKLRAHAAGLWVMAEGMERLSEGVRGVVFTSNAGGAPYEVRPEVERVIAAAIDEITKERGN